MKVAKLLRVDAATHLGADPSPLVSLLLAEVCRILGLRSALSSRRLHANIHSRVNVHQFRTRRPHGAALPTVLMLVSLVLVIGLAMGSLSTLSLQFNRRQVDGTKAEMAARTGLAHLTAKLRAKATTEGIDPLNPKPFKVADEFPGGLVVKEGDYEVKIHFSAQPGFSTDNLSGDSPAVGWPDRNDDVPRIPPFGLDVILNVTGPSSSHRYRATLQRIWPFGLYANRGPIVLMGQPAPGDPKPSRVTGDIYTSWQGDEANGGTMVTGYGVGYLSEPRDILANMEAKTGFHPHKKPDFPAIIGMEYGHNPALSRDDSLHSTTEDHYFHYAKGTSGMSDFPTTVSADSLRPVSLEAADGGNVLDGDFVYHHDKNVPEMDPIVLGTTPNVGTLTPDTVNEYLGKSIRKRSLVADPLAQIGTNPFPASSFTSLPGLQVADDQLISVGFPELASETHSLDFFPDKSGGVPAYFLKDDLVQNGGHISVNGTLSNRQVVYYKGAAAKGPGLYVRERRVGMSLQNTVLHVKGDLDLGASSFPQPDNDPTTDDDSITISGAGATLIVDGQLILGNAVINAQDQGFVIYARDIVLKGGGNFHGLMIASNSITILSQDQPLKIRGALMCAGLGGIILKGCELEYDPEYVKSVHGGGDFAVTAWKRLD